MTSQRRIHWQLIFTLGLIWAVVGAVYSAILVANLAFLQRFDMGPLSIGLAASLAGAVGALFYGSVRLALLAAIAALIAAFGYSAFVPLMELRPEAIFMVSALAGTIVGAHYGHLMQGSRVRKATAKALTGLYAGFVAGLPLVLLTAWQGEVRMTLAAAIATPLTGVVYVFSVRRMMVLMNIPASPVLSGALVGGGVAGLVGIAAWAFISIFNGAVTGAAADAVRFAWTELPHAALGGVAGGFLAGMAMAAVGFGWSEDA